MANTTTCPACGKEIPADTSTCPYCGHQTFTSVEERLAWVSQVMGEPDLIKDSAPIVDERVPESQRDCPQCHSRRVALDESGFLGSILKGKGNYYCLECGHRWKSR